MSSALSKSINAATHKAAAQNSCDHQWIANRGAGGKPKFDQPNMADYRKKLMKGQCALCDGRRWFTETEWAKAKKAPQPKKKGGK